MGNQEYSYNCTCIQTAWEWVCSHHCFTLLSLSLPVWQKVHDNIKSGSIIGLGTDTVSTFENVTLLAKVCPCCLFRSRRWRRNIFYLSKFELYCCWVVWTRAGIRERMLLIRVKVWSHHLLCARVCERAGKLSPARFQPAAWLWLSLQL